MATIIQFPNSISFLENLKAVRIASSETVAFKLSSGGSTILEETYSPGPSGIVEVELRDVISEYLAIAYPSSDVFNQASAIAQMTVNVDDDEDQDFTVLSGGVRGLSTTDESFLRANWLTWQPQTKTVRWNQPEYLTFAHLSAGTVKAKFYTKAGGSETVTLHSASAGQVNTYRMQMSTLFAASSYEPEGLYGLVDVWVENGGVQQSYVQRYVCTPETRDEHYFSCVNSLGGIDTFCFTGPQTLAPSVEHAAALRGDRKIDITPAPGRSWTQNTGDLDKAESKWIWDFFNSSRHWAAIDGELEEIVIESSSVRASDAENLNAFDFAFSPVNTGRTMKIDRTSGQLPAMQVLSPTGDLFFLAPRIVDYPDATIDASLLLLTQSPLVQEWQKIGIGPLCDYLSDQIHNTSWGQLAHTHSNKTVIDALSEQGGKLLFNGQPVTPDIPQMPDHYIAGTKAKTSESDEALSRVTKISFTAATAASESVDLEVVTINGQRFLHTSLPFFSDSEITAGGVGSGETPGPATTLGALLNVDSEADDTPTTDKILVREAGSTHWTITDLADISGAVTGVRMNSSLMPISDKVVDLGTVITSLEGYATEAYVSGNYLASSQKGAANGVASLDGSGKILFAQLPDAILGQLLYGGTVNASGVATLSTNVKTKLGISAATVQLTNDAGTYGYGKFEGVYFIMSADSGFASLGLKVGDWLISTGSAWKKIDNTDAVTGVKGDAETDYRIGNVNITKANIGLGNVENTALSTWTGSANITTLGTVAAGVWQGTAIDDSYIASAATWNALKTLFESMFERHGSGTDADPYTIKAKYALWSPFEITAGGVGSGGGGSTGTLATLLDVKHSSGNVIQRLSGGDVQTGDLFLKGDSTHWYALAKGSNGQILKMVNGLPSWGDAPATGVTSISVNSGAAQTGAVALTIPTKTSDLTNDSGFITSSVLSSYQPLATAINTGNIGSQTVARSNELVCEVVASEDQALPSTGDTFRAYRVSSTTTPGADGHIIAFTWTGTNAFGAQLFIDTDPTGVIALRQRSHTGEWTSWNTLYHSGNLSGYEILNLITASGTNVCSTNTEQTIDGKKTFRKSLHTDGGLYARYINLSPENNGTILPFICNDIAFIDKRGGTLSLYSTTSTDFTPLVLAERGEIAYWGQISTVVDGTAKYINGPGSAVAGKTVVFDIDFGQLREYYASNAYIDFYSESWVPEERPSFYFLLEGESTYRPANGYHEGEEHSIRIATFNDYDAVGVKAMRVVMKFAPGRTTQFRIAEIGIVNSNTPLLGTAYMSRGNNDDLWRDLCPADSNTYNLGESGKRWNNIYANTINLAGGAQIAGGVKLISTSLQPSPGYLGNGTVGIKASSPSGSPLLYGIYAWVYNDSGMANLQCGYENGNTSPLPLSIQPFGGNCSFGGNVGIGTTSPSEKLHIVGNIVASGEITAGSDIRWKENIAPVQGNPIMSLNPVEWDWKEGHGEGHSAGFIAQQVMTVIPFAVKGTEKDGYTLNYNVLHAYEVKAIQSHEQRIAALEMENAELKRQLSTIRS